MKNEKIFYSNKNFTYPLGGVKKNIKSTTTHKTIKINRKKVSRVLNKVLVILCFVAISFITIHAVGKLIHKIQELNTLEDRAVLDGEPTNHTNYLDNLQNK